MDELGVRHGAVHMLGDSAFLNSSMLRCQTVSCLCTVPRENSSHYRALYVIIHISNYQTKKGVFVAFPFLGALNVNGL